MVGAPVLFGLPRFTKRRAGRTARWVQTAGWKSYGGLPSSADTYHLGALEGIDAGRPVLRAQPFPARGRLGVDLGGPLAALAVVAAPGEHLPPVARGVH